MNPVTYSLRGDSFAASGVSEEIQRRPSRPAAVAQMPAEILILGLLADTSGQDWGSTGSESRRQARHSGRISCHLRYEDI